MAPPPALVVRYNPAAHLRRMAVILLFFALSVAGPFLLDEPSRAQLRFYAVITILLLAWALAVARQSRDRQPRVIIDADGLFVRDWHLGTADWDDIALVGLASALRLPLATRVFRRRLGDHLVVRFLRFPPFQTSARPPLSWLQWVSQQLDNSDPIISPAKLDARLADIMAAIEVQIAHRKQTKNH